MNKSNIIVISFIKNNSIKHSTLSDSLNQVHILLNNLISLRSELLLMRISQLQRVPSSFSSALSSCIFTPAVSLTLHS